MTLTSRAACQAPDAPSPVFPDDWGPGIRDGPRHRPGFSPSAGRVPYVCRAVYRLSASSTAAWCCTGFGAASPLPTSPARTARSPGSALWSITYGTDHWAADEAADRIDARPDANQVGPSWSSRSGGW